MTFKYVRWKRTDIPIVDKVQWDIVSWRGFFSVPIMVDFKTCSSLGSSKLASAVTESEVAEEPNVSCC